nr:MAG TPA: hypothetical protein [Caudoviricetes sp.]DAO97937.1 MAG TPA: hypothetical protein [Caudoviricetes sp.]
MLPEWGGGSQLPSIHGCRYFPKVLYSRLSTRQRNFDVYLRKAQKKRADGAKESGIDLVVARYYSKAT